MLIKKLIEKGINISSKVAETFMDKGDVKYLILYALNKKPMHGYEIMNNIKEDFLGMYSPSPGTIYPTLQMLEEQKMIKIKSEGKKKTYSITKKGKEFLNKNKKKITGIMESVKKSEILPQVKKMTKEFNKLGKETIKLAMITAEENKEKVKKNAEKTSKIIKETMKELRKTWKE